MIEFITQSAIVQSVKRKFVRGSVFEVKQNAAGQWFVHERASNGQIKDVTESYASKSNAKRAAKKMASDTKAATWKVLPPLPPVA